MENADLLHPEVLRSRSDRTPRKDALRHPSGSLARRQSHSLRFAQRSLIIGYRRRASSFATTRTELPYPVAEPRRWSFSLVQSNGPRDGDGIARDQARLARVAAGDEAAFAGARRRRDAAAPPLRRLDPRLRPGRGRGGGAGGADPPLAAGGDLAARRPHLDLAAPGHLSARHRHPPPPPALGRDRDRRGHAGGCRSRARGAADRGRGRRRRFVPRSRACPSASGRRSRSAISRGSARPRRRR